jgi:cytochrome P450/NADPH-cytochrome P450 reductase
LLSFLFYCLLDNPRAYSKLQEEIDTVIGKSTVTFEHMSKLPYLEACLRETLRLYPTAPALMLVAKGDQIVADGRYLIKNGENILLLLENLHRDPEVRQINAVRKMLNAALADVVLSLQVYGPDAETFRPERMYKEAFHALSPNAWKPFVSARKNQLATQKMAQLLTAPSF